MSIMTHKTVILLALKHSIIEKTWSMICSSLVAASIRTSQRGNHLVLTIAIKLALRLGKLEFYTGED